MGRKHTRAGKYIYLCIACIIFLSFYSCATSEKIISEKESEGYIIRDRGFITKEEYKDSLPEPVIKRSDEEVKMYLIRGRKLLAKGEYKGALHEYEKILSLPVSGDKALFNIALIYAHYGNIDKDYEKSIHFFNKLVLDYPQSTLVEEARIWINILDVIEKKEKEIEELKSFQEDKETAEHDSIHEHLLLSQTLLSEGDYDESLKENQKVLSLANGMPPGDQALFNIGLIYAHYSNPEKDYKKSISYFNRLIKEHPHSSLTEQAQILIAILDVIEKTKQVDIEIEKRKKKLTK